MLISRKCVMWDLTLGLCAAPQLQKTHWRSREVPELDAIEEVTDEVEREEKMNYSAESENEVEEKGAEEENKKEENREDERDVETSCDALLEEAGEKSNDETSLGRLHFDVEDVVQTPIMATRVTQLNVDKLTQTALNSNAQLKTQPSSSKSYVAKLALLARVPFLNIGALETRPAIDRYSLAIQTQYDRQARKMQRLVDLAVQLLLIEGILIFVRDFTSNPMLNDFLRLTVCLLNGCVFNAVFKSNLMIYSMFKSNHHLMCWKRYNLRFIELSTSLFFQQSLELDSRGYAYIPIKNHPLLNSNTTGACDGEPEIETKDSGSLDVTAKADSPEKLELVESRSSK
ncbi:unnamed protein product [Dibothriocephalus latus]|uniref:Uncharacterized protein n=1 Tax=Dibothriocephalus latus TaxID=60516 RepID=A0A3P7R5L9_DIBLA|nr:unnamed protein product [Dibothriocephalus latus]